MTHAEKMIEWISASPTAFHAVDTAKASFAGFEELCEKDTWQLLPGHKYMVTRNRSAIIAFVMPEKTPSGFLMAAAHTDSPMFKIKENAEIEAVGKYIQLDVERYGGAILSSWFDRPLTISGRVIVRTEKGIETRLVTMENAVIIPNMPIHMNREINDGYKYNAATDLQPLWGVKADKGQFRATVAAAAGCTEDQIAATDLYVCNSQKGLVWGPEGEFVSAPRLDNLGCCYAIVEALCTAKPAETHVQLGALFDNEEVGSGSIQGAKGTFLKDVLNRIAASCGMAGTGILPLLASSFMVSADNAHAQHPNHPEQYNKNHASHMNEGVVIKFNASQKYTTDGISEAIFRCACQKAGAPVQMYANRPDKPGGSTLGNLSMEQVSVPTVDIGMAQLAMHSSFETCGAKDAEYMVNAIRAFYELQLEMTADGNYNVG